MDLYGDQNTSITELPNLESMHKYIRGISITQTNPCFKLVFLKGFAVAVITCIPKMVAHHPMLNQSFAYVGGAYNGVQLYTFWMCQFLAIGMLESHHDSRNLCPLQRNLPNVMRWISNNPGKVPWGTQRPAIAIGMLQNPQDGQGYLCTSKETGW